ncbi:hypothetical protein BK796_22960 [Kosakonia pseudosacchari]|uniref:Uncharacterized protein n=1 Tax=Kosakonia pseudosacchari TaxID=1646340 RepID=A0ABX4IIV6_9ENTR|nr:hypothetical protein BK796_22960 [Kosakonia pseudosacchari]
MDLHHDNAIALARDHTGIEQRVDVERIDRNESREMVVFSTVLHEITAFLRLVAQNVSDRTFCAIF